MTYLKVSYCESHFCKKLSQTNLLWLLAKVLRAHLQVEQRKLQVKSGVSWVLLCCDSDRPITAHCLRKKTFRNRTQSISES